jgi:hypothetical protein
MVPSEEVDSTVFRKAENTKKIIEWTVLKFIIILVVSGRLSLECESSL